MTMKNRKKIDYEDIVEMGISLIKDETDFIYECSDDSTRAQSAFRISGIIDFLSELDKATRITEEAVVEEIKEE